MNTKNKIFDNFKNLKDSVNDNFYIAIRRKDGIYSALGSYETKKQLDTALNKYFTNREFLGIPIYPIERVEGKKIRILEDLI